jgi:hypothetical protein
MQEKNACGRTFFQFATRTLVLLDGPELFSIKVFSSRRSPMSPGRLVLDCWFTFAVTFIRFQGACE